MKGMTNAAVLHELGRRVREAGAEERRAMLRTLDTETRLSMAISHGRTLWRRGALRSQDELERFLEDVAGMADDEVMRLERKTAGVPEFLDAREAITWAMGYLRSAFTSLEALRRMEEEFAAYRSEGGA